MATDLVGVGPTLEADDWPDADSATGSLDDGGSETTSVDTSIMRYRLENGRSYHSFRDGRYVLPNDEREKDRLDLQHHMSLITLDNKLLLAPIDGDGDGDRAADGPPTGRPPVQRVLDVGTGTGIWAMDFADSHPSAQVIGNDLSAIQPRMVPSNCDFEVDDVEAEWTHRVPFDVVYCRMLVGSLKDWPRFFAQAFAHLRPAGWCETHNIDFPVRCDDGTLTPDHALYKWSANQLDGFNRIGSSIAIGSRYRRMMLDAGFERVSQVVHKWPVNAWPKGRKEKTLGAFEQENFLNGLQAFTLAIHTRVLGWSAGECELFMADVRKDIKNRSIHAYFPV